MINLIIGLLIKSTYVPTHPKKDDKFIKACLKAIKHSEDSQHRLTHFQYNQFIEPIIKLNQRLIENDVTELELYQIRDTFATMLGDSIQKSYGKVKAIRDNLPEALQGNYRPYQSELMHKNIEANFTPKYLIDKTSFPIEPYCDGKEYETLVQAFKMLLEVPSLDDSNDNEMKEEFGINLWHLISHLGCEWMLPELEKLDIDKQAKSNKDQLPIHVAAAVNNIPYFTYLLDNTVNYTDEDNDKNNCLHYAARSGSITITSRLLATQEFEINEPNNELKTPLLVAVENGHLELVQYLLKSGASYQAVDQYNNTVIHLGALAGHCNIVRYFIDHIKNQYQLMNEPQHLASSQRDYVRQFINQENSSGQTALTLATDYYNANLPTSQGNLKHYRSIIALLNSYVDIGNREYISIPIARSLEDFKKSVPITDVDKRNNKWLYGSMIGLAVVLFCAYEFMSYEANGSFSMGMVVLPAALLSVFACMRFGFKYCKLSTETEQEAQRLLEEQPSQQNSDQLGNRFSQGIQSISRTVATSASNAYEKLPSFPRVKQSGREFFGKMRDSLRSNDEAILMQGLSMDAPDSLRETDVEAGFTGIRRGLALSGDDIDSPTTQSYNEFEEGMMKASSRKDASNLYSSRNQFDSHDPVIRDKANRHGSEKGRHSLFPKVKNPVTIVKEKRVEKKRQAKIASPLSQ